MLRKMGYGKNQDVLHMNEGQRGAFALALLDESAEQSGNGL